jgi:hypothetical protein
MLDDQDEDDDDDDKMGKKERGVWCQLYILYL